MPRQKTTAIFVRVTDDIRARIVAAAEADNRTVTNLARILIQEGLERREDPLKEPQE